MLLSPPTLLSCLFLTQKDPLRTNTENGYLSLRNHSSFIKGTTTNSLISTRLHLSSSDVTITETNTRSERTSGGSSSSGDDMEDIFSLFHIYARFSPLIGGPALLPIHVEILLLEHVNENLTDSMNGSKPIVMNKNNYNEHGDHPAMTTTVTKVLHRIDFIPKDPTNSDTITNLMLLKSVDGLVRHQKLVVGNDNDDEEYPSSNSGNHEEDDRHGIELSQEEKENSHIRTNFVSSDRIEYLLSSKYKSGKLSFVLPLGSVKANVIIDDDVDKNNIRTPISVSELVQCKKGMELNLVQNNCYSFAFDVLQSLKVFSN